MNSNKLKARMVERGINGQTLSREIGISESAFYRKLNGTSEFTQGEIKAIAQALEMDTESMLAIFFADEVS
jgi:transcriptional regulator with XRE-family HTH domain